MHGVSEGVKAIRTGVYCLPMIDFDLIEDGLWLGPAPTAPEDYAALAGLGITDVLTLQPEEEAQQAGVHPSVAFRIAARHGMVIHRVPI